MLYDIILYPPFPPKRVKKIIEPSLAQIRPAGRRVCESRSADREATAPDLLPEKSLRAPPIEPFLLPICICIYIYIYIYMHMQIYK